MSYIFWGALFSLLDFNLELGGSVIGLIPDFVGYFLILRGIKQMAHHSKHFIKMRVPALTMLIISAVIYLLNLLGTTLYPGIPVILLISVASVAFDLYLYYQLALGIKEIETTNKVMLNADSLMRAWYFLLLANAAALFVSLSATIMAFMMIAAFALIIFFLITLYRSKVMFEQWNNSNRQEIQYTVGPKIEEDDTDSETENNEPEQE